MTVVGDFSVRGGIKTVVTASYQKPGELDNLEFGIWNAVRPVHLPIEREIDLHAFAPADIPSVVEEYVTAAVEAGIAEVRIVHGRGRGVQRGIVQAVLERHPVGRGVLGRSSHAPGRDVRAAQQ